MRRWIVVVSIVLASVVVGAGLAENAWPNSSAVQAAPVNQTISALHFSNNVGDEFLPINPRTYFDRDNDGVWVTFEYINFSGGKVSFLARANDSDYAWGDLNCCKIPESRYGFKLTGRGRHRGDVPENLSMVGAFDGTPMLGALGTSLVPTSRLPGAAYDVFIYLNDMEWGWGGFGVRGGRGLDDGDPNSNSDDDDDD